MMLQVTDIEKKFKNESVLKGVSFNLNEGTTLSILGKSGCGKTTLLKIIAGLEDANSGNIQLSNEVINDIAPNKRGVVYLYQESLLFPHLNVWENIAFGLRLKKELSEDEIKERVQKMIADLDLEAHATKMPEQLSGGQKQRVSFGRALIINPKLLLLDEPFGNLDTETRGSMQLLFKQVAKQYNITAVFVTHDLKEAVLMGDELGYMSGGKLKVYKSRAEFMQDDATGIKQEMEFWGELTKQANE